MRRYEMHVNGTARPATRYEPVKSPYSGEIVGEVALGNDADIEAAIDSTSRAFAHTRLLPTHERARLLVRDAGRAIRKGAFPDRAILRQNLEMHHLLFANALV